jgi:hypothetical protein
MELYENELADLHRVVTVMTIDEIERSVLGLSR